MKHNLCLYSPVWFCLPPRQTKTIFVQNSANNADICGHIFRCYVTFLTRPSIHHLHGIKQTLRNDVCVWCHAFSSIHSARVCSVVHCWYCFCALQIRLCPPHTTTYFTRVHWTLSLFFSLCCDDEQGLVMLVGRSLCISDIHIYREHQVIAADVGF